LDYQKELLVLLPAALASIPNIEVSPIIHRLTTNSHYHVCNTTNRRTTEHAKERVITKMWREAAKAAQGISNSAFHHHIECQPKRPCEYSIQPPSA
jgi:hypothetical protein